MPDAEPPLLPLQRAITDILDADSWFDQIPILNEAMGDIEFLTDSVLAKLKVCVVVQSPFGNHSFPNIPDIYFNECPIVVSSYAHTELNKVSTGGTGIHPLNTAQIIAALLHLTRIEALADANGNMPMLTAADPTIVQVRDELSKGIIGWDVYFKAAIGFRYTPEPSLVSNSNAALLNNSGLEITIN